MANNNVIRELRPHFDEIHEHEGRRCDPKRLIITEPIVGLGAAAVSAYTERMPLPSNRFKKKLLRAFDDTLEVAQPKLFVYGYGVLGFLELHINQRFTVGDISRGTRIPGNVVNPVVKRLWWDGELRLETSECPDSIVNDDEGQRRFDPDTQEPVRQELAYIDHIRGHRKKAPFTLSFVVPTIARIIPEVRSI